MGYAPAVKDGFARDVAKLVYMRLRLRRRTMQPQGIARVFGPGKFADVADIVTAKFIGSRAGPNDRVARRIEEEDAVEVVAHSPGTLGVEADPIIPNGVF